MRLTINVQDTKANFFIELVKNFDFVKIEDSDFDIPEEHKDIVRKRIKEIEKNPERLLDWNKTRNNLKLD